MRSKPSVQTWAIEKIAVRLEPGARVLEVGCGSARTSQHLAERGFAVRCADVGRWHDEIEGVDHTSGADLSRRLPFADDQFDALLSFEVLEHLTNPFNAVGELSRILRPQGQLFLTLPNFWSARARWRFLWRGSVNRSRVRDEGALRDLVSGACPPHINTMPWTTLKYALVAYGFEVVEVSGYRRNVTPHLAFLPLAALIWLATHALPRRRRQRFELDESNRWSILLGSRHVFIHARKLRDAHRSDARALPRASDTARSSAQNAVRSPSAHA